MRDWTKMASERTLNKVAQALVKNGFGVVIVRSGEEAKKKILELIPERSEVMANTSVTLETIGVTAEIDESGRYDSVRKKTMSLDKEKDKKQIKCFRSTPKYAIGSVHAITESGQIMLASATGSQIPSYTYGAEKVIWVVGTHKIVKDLTEGVERIQKHSFPLEDKRALKAYGAGSAINRILIVNAEPIPNRTAIIFVKENLGY